MSETYQHEEKYTMIYKLLAFLAISVGNQAFQSPTPKKTDQDLQHP